MPVFPSNRAEVISRYLDSLTSNTSINQITPGSKARSIGETFARELELMSQLLEANFDKGFLSTSFGQFLARHVITYGIRKRPARNAEILASDKAIKFFAENNVTFGSINGDESFTIPAGTILTAPVDVALETGGMFLNVTEPDSYEDRSIHYTITEDVFCEATAREVYVSARCMVEGTQGNLAAPNMLTQHAFTGYNDYLTSKLKLTNTSPILSGVDTESDNSLRFRGSKAVTSAEGSNEDAISEKILKIPGVVDYVIIPFEDGVGRFNVYLKSITSTVSDRMIEEAQEVLDSVQATGCVGFARRPMEIGVEIKTNLTYDKSYSEQEKDLIRQNLIYAAVTFINSLDIGQPLALPVLEGELKAIDNRVTGVGTNITTLFDNVYLHVPARLSNTGKRREKLITGSINTAPHARVVVEPSVSNAIQMI